MLSDKECKNLKPKDKTYCVSDEKSLYMEVHPNGSKYWMWKYRYACKQKRIALGVYPEVSLKDAREKREEMRKILKAGEDPAELRKKKKIEVRENTVNTFENIAREWFEKKKHTLAERYGTQLLGRLEADIFPFLGSTPIENITSKELLTVIRKIEERGATESAHRILQTVGQVFEYAIADDRAENNIATGLSKLLKPHEATNRPHFSEKEFKEFLNKLPDFKGNIITKLALNLLILTFVRSGELRGARWEEFDFEKKEWRIPAERMKMKEQHIVPLSKQAIAIIDEIRKITGDGELLFPCRTDTTKPISDNTLSKALRSQGYQDKVYAQFDNVRSCNLEMSGFK